MHFENYKKCLRLAISDMSDLSMPESKAKQINTNNINEAKKYLLKLKKRTRNMWKGDKKQKSCGDGFGPKKISGSG